MTTASLDPRRFYVYQITRDGIPIYIGKGQGRRMDQHFVGRAYNPRLANAISKDRREGTGRIARSKVVDCLTEDEAFALEVRLIAQHGRLPDGPLFNRTAGGVGVVDLPKKSRFNWSKALVERRQPSGSRLQRLRAIGPIDQKIYVHVFTYVDQKTFRSISIREANSKEARYYENAIKN